MSLDGCPSETIIHLRQSVLYGHNLLQSTLYIFWQLKRWQGIAVKTDAEYALIVILRINHVYFRCISRQWWKNELHIKRILTNILKRPWFVWLEPIVRDYLAEGIGAALHIS